MVILKTFDDLRADLSVAAGFDKAAVSAFIGENSTPLVQEFSQEVCNPTCLSHSTIYLSMYYVWMYLYAQASKKIFSSPIQKHVLFFTNKKSAYHADTHALYSTVAAEFKGKALFINVPSTENKYARTYIHTIA